MKTTTSLIAAATLMLTLVACGPGAKIGGGKQGAAAAATALSAPTRRAADRAATPADLTDLNSTCSKGGTAKLSNFKAQVDTSGGGASVSQTFTMQLVACGLASSELGTALYNGTVEVSQKVITGANGVQIEQSFKGRVSIDGAFSDYLDTDVAQTVDISSLGTDGSVSVLLKGSVANSSGTYAFNEVVNVTQGSLAVQTPSAN
jgi:hypothetical protein